MVSNPMSRDPAVTVGIGGDASGLDNAVASAKGSLAGLRKSVGVTSGALAALGGAAIGGSISAFGDFDEAMQESVAVMGDVDEGMRERLEETASEVATTTRQSHEEAAESFYFLASAGLDAQESIAAMPEVADFAAAGNMEMAEATDVATNVMSAFGYEADQMNEVTDTLAGTVANHNQTMEGMSTAMSRVAPTASSLGISIEETSAALGMLGDVGIQGQRAGTALNRVFAALSDETSTASQQLEEMGVQVRDSEGNLLSFEEIMRNMNEAGIEASEASQIFGTEAGPAMAALLDQGGDALGENTDRIADMEGATEEMAETQRDTLNAEIDIFRSRLNDIAITIGEAFMPMVNDMMDAVNDAADRFSEFIDTVDEGTIAKILGGGTFGAITTAITALVSGPIGLLIGAIGLLATAWAEDWGNIRETAQQALELVVSIWEDNQDQIMTLVDTIADTLREFGELFFEVVGGIVDFLSDHQEEISDLIGAVIEVFTEVAGVVGDVLGDVTQWFEENREEIETAIDGVMDVLTGLADFFTQTLLPAARRVLNWLAPRIDRVVGALARNLGPVISEVGQTLSSLAGYANTVGSVMTDVWNAIDGVVVPIVSGLADILETGLVYMIDQLSESMQLVMNLVQGDFGGALENLENLLGNALEAGLDILGIIKDGFVAAAEWLLNEGPSAFVDAMGALMETTMDIGEIIIDIMNNAGEWLTDEVAKPFIDRLAAIVKRAVIAGVTLGLSEFEGSDNNPATSGRIGRVSDAVEEPDAQTGGFISRGGLLNVHAGERVVPASQVTDRGEVSVEGGGGSQEVVVRFEGEGGLVDLVRREATVTVEQNNRQQHRIRRSMNARPGVR